ncbi:expressed unknown protein [Seminavis robusta]|uniref:Uncharacterized protein n=1 Tax=Seminavis robusta TaxID=568900 RepID=A0A9N8DTD4_9STRA|nr:expressed unknown protein [Seminavis robusta]|eukprot:Sro328_g118540.1 n/a (338) ;mRNA; r:6228-7365
MPETTYAANNYLDSLTRYIEIRSVSDILELDLTLRGDYYFPLRFPIWNHECEGPTNGGLMIGTSCSFSASCYDLIGSFAACSGWTLPKVTALATQEAHSAGSSPYFAHDKTIVPCPIASSPATKKADVMPPATTLSRSNVEEEESWAIGRNWKHALLSMAELSNVPCPRLLVGSCWNFMKTLLAVEAQWNKSRSLPLGRVYHSDANKTTGRNSITEFEDRNNNDGEQDPGEPTIDSEAVVVEFCSDAIGYACVPSCSAEEVQGLISEIKPQHVDLSCFDIDYSFIELLAAAGRRGGGTSAKEEAGLMAKRVQQLQRQGDVSLKGGAGLFADLLHRQP